MKKHSAVLFMLAVSLLTGCDQVDNWVEQKGLEKAGIENSEEYKKYQEYSSNSEYTFDETGLAVTNFDNEAVPAMASISGIHITAAENSNLDVKYYYDEGRTQEITDIGSVGFNKNDVIYVQAAPKSDENKLYEFSEIAVYDINENGEKNNAVNGIWDIENSLIRIPEDYSGTELAIEPLGQYLLCKATFEAYCSDGQTDTPVDCSWTLDGHTYNQSTAELDPTLSHNISVTFDDKNYYCVSSDRSSGFTDERNIQDKTVAFQNVMLNDTECRFAVELHKLIKCSFGNSKADGIKAVYVNGDRKSGDDKADKTKELTGLKVGDKITLELNDGYKAECMQFSAQSSEVISGGTKEVFLIPETSDTVQIMVIKSSDEIYHYQDISFDHATMTATVNATNYVLKHGDAISGSDEITVKIVPDEGYTISESSFLFVENINVKNNVYTKTMKYSEYQKNRNQIIKDIEITN